LWPAKTSQQPISQTTLLKGCLFVFIVSIKSYLWQSEAGKQPTSLSAWLKVTPPLHNIATTAPFPLHRSKGCNNGNKIFCVFAWIQEWESLCFASVLGKSLCRLRTSPRLHRVMGGSAFLLSKHRTLASTMPPPLG
jgi:hypothetical protein